MLTTKLTTILFTLPEDQELHDQFIRNNDMKLWSKYGSGERVTYARVEQSTTSQKDIGRGASQTYPVFIQ